MSTGSSEAPYSFEKNDSLLQLTLKPELNDVQWSEIDSLGTQVLTELESKQSPMMLVDLSPLSYMGSAMVALIVRLWKAVKARNGKMAVVCPHDMVREVLVLAGLDKVWTITDTREEAVKSLGLKEAQAMMYAPAPPGGGVVSSAGGQYVQAAPQMSGSADNASSLVVTAVLLTLSIIGVLVGIGGIVMLLSVKAVPGTVALGVALGGAGVAFLTGLICVIQSGSASRYVGIGTLVASVAVLVIGLLNKP